MANLEQNLSLITMISADDMSAAQYRFVSIDADGKVALTGAGLKADGVNQEAPVVDEATVVAISGISFLEVGAGGVTAGDDVASDATGKVVAGVTDDSINGVAVATAAAGELVAVLLGFGGVVPA